jgi:hypothetical protein
VACDNNAQSLSMLVTRLEMKIDIPRINGGNFCYYPRKEHIWKGPESNSLPNYLKLRFFHAPESNKKC